jgi:hypothetical protein
MVVQPGSNFSHANANANPSQMSVSCRIAHRLLFLEPVAPVRLVFEQARQSQRHH